MNELIPYPAPMEPARGPGPASADRTPARSRDRSLPVRDDVLPCLEHRLERYALAGERATRNPRYRGGGDAHERPRSLGDRGGPASVRRTVPRGEDRSPPPSRGEGQRRRRGVSLREDRSLREVVQEAAESEGARGLFRRGLVGRALQGIGEASAPEREARARRRGGITNASLRPALETTPAPGSRPSGERASHEDLIARNGTDARRVDAPPGPPNRRLQRGCPGRARRRKESGAPREGRLLPTASMSLPRGRGARLDRSG